MFGIETLWTTSLILKALHEDILKKSDARETIENMVKNGYRLSEDVLLKIIKEIEEYKK
jgi:predicted nucleic acid-binding protein